MPAGREGTQVTVRKRQHDEISGRLPQVLRHDGFLDAVRFAEDDMHRPISLAARSG